jgi:predicted dehydrogenase
MNVLVIGAGRMGQRHIKGCMNSTFINEIFVLDISNDSLENARKTFFENINFTKLKFINLKQFVPTFFDIVIISATASDRLSICKLAIDCSPKYILIEKPLGQSYEEVEELVNYFTNKNINVHVNLNMRMYGFIRELKNDLQTLPQFQGVKRINYNGGSLGIGANGIHYIDLLFYLFDANRFELKYAEIDRSLLPSGRGENFKDFGGSAMIYFFKDDELKGKSFLSLTSESTAFGGWDIIGTHVRIRINEIEASRIDICRNENSSMPINRYAADYKDPVSKNIITPDLSDLTTEWITCISKSIFPLPMLSETLIAHKLMFDWLSHSDTYKDTFPIT